MLTTAATVIIAPNEGDLVQHAYVTVPARNKQNALMVALDALDAHADRHGWVVSIESYEIAQVPDGLLPDGHYLVLFS
jgi:hypothetical protein